MVFALKIKKGVCGEIGIVPQYGVYAPTSLKHVSTRRGGQHYGRDQVPRARTSYPGFLKHKTY